MAVSAQMVKELRDATGASVLDCKKALEQYGGDMEQAKAYLTEKGLATAEKKAGRAANDGKIETYTHHGGRVGVMLEVNCETDFVANTDQFQDLAHNLALHIAFAAPEYLSVEDIPADVLEEHKAAFRSDPSTQGKPDEVVERIVEGRLNKWYSDVVLLEQPYVKDGDLTISDLLTQAIAELKENVRIRRFARFALDEHGEDEAEG